MTRFIDSHLHFQEVSGFDKVKESVGDKSQFIPNVTNYRDFVFKICPKLNYEFHNEYKKRFTKVIHNTQKNLAVFFCNHSTLMLIIMLQQ